MESGLRNAWIVAGLKMGLGLLFVGALLAIRMVTASPEHDVAGGSESAEEVARATHSESPNSALPSAASTSEEPSLLARAASRVAESVTGSSTRTDAGDRMVSCKLRGRVQFMTAADCAVRGGVARSLGDDR